MTCQFHNLKKILCIFGAFCWYAAQLCGGGAAMRGTGQPQQDTESLLLFCTRPVQTGLFLYSLFYVLHTTQLEKAKMNQGLVLC